MKIGTPCQDMQDLDSLNKTWIVPRSYQDLDSTKILGTSW